MIPDAEALAAQKLNAEVGTKIAEARRLQETDPEKAIAIYEQTMKAVKASGLSPNLMRPMVRRLEVAIELAKKDKVAFEVKMQDKQQRAEIELKRLRILEADKAKKGRMKELMDKAQAAYAEGNYVECEAYAKKAAEVDPNEVAATMLVFKSRMERRYKQDMETKAAKEEGAGHGLPGSRPGVGRRSRGSGQRHQVPQELQGPDPRAAADEPEARGQEGSQGPGHRGEAEGADLAEHGQAAAQRGDHLPAELHGPEHRPRPQGPQRRGADLGRAGLADRQQRPDQDRAEAAASPAGPDLQGRGRGPADHQSPGSTTPDVPENVLRRRPDHAREQGPQNPLAAVANAMGSGSNPADGGGALGQAAAALYPGQTPAARRPT